MSSVKEYNLQRHYQTSQKHTDKDKNMDTEQGLQKMEELKQGLKSRQALFTKAKSQKTVCLKFVMQCDQTKGNY